MSNSPQPSRPQQSESAVRGAFKHPIWISLGTLIAVTGLVVTFVQMRQSDTNKPASVEVGAVTFGNPQTIQAVSYGSWDKTDRSPADKKAAPIDITLTNNGDNPLHIKEIRADVIDARTINCNQQGGGILVSAEYSIAVPYNPWQMKATSTTVSTPIDFTVKESSSDRMLVTVGPSEEGNGNPIVLAVQLTLIPDEGNPIAIEPLAVVQPDAAETQIKSLHMYTGLGIIDDCVTQAEATLDSIYSATKVQSPGVDYLRDQLPKAV